MRCEEALAQLNVSQDLLSHDEKQFLDEQGYLPLPEIMNHAQVDALRTRFDELVEEEGEKAGTEVHQEAGTNRLSNLVDKGEIFEICFTHPRVLAAMRHVLGPDFRLSSLNGRSALPGQGLQGLHADWATGVEPGDYYVCNSIWLLSDFTEQNGATRVVPGSNRSGQHPKDALDDPTAPHPDEVILTALAGTVVVFNSHTWHGGTLNRSDEPRYGLHSYFTRRDQRQQTAQKALLSEETKARLSEAARVILDV
ncbi:MAG: phytanoyl-CoA dioxygenase family protein [Candidatus Latescibacterota bacterium]|nr:phytanoyl-CoA dioxygenase family protein [Candidatus Latescibacterota bacterium]